MLIVARYSNAGNRSDNILGNVAPLIPEVFSMNLPLPSKTNPEGRPIAKEPPREPRTRQLGCQVNPFETFSEIIFYTLNKAQFAHRWIFKWSILISANTIAIRVTKGWPIWSQGRCFPRLCQRDRRWWRMEVWNWWRICTWIRKWRQYEIQIGNTKLQWQL